MRKLTILSFIILIISFSPAQENIFNLPVNDSYIYLSPYPGSTDNPSESTIIVREGSVINRSTLSYKSFDVFGSISGKIEGDVILASDSKTILFIPKKLFDINELISVKINAGIETISGISIQPISFSFMTSESYSAEPEISYRLINKTESSNNNFSDLPKISTQIYKQGELGEGKLFLSAYGVINQNFQSNPQINSSVLIAENDGSVFFSKDIGSNKGAGLTDFKMHSNGMMSYPKSIKKYPWTGGAEVIQMIMDKSFNIVDSVQMGNGYTAETHDFQILPNGHYLLMAYYLVPVDLSKTVSGAPPDAYIDGAVIQELDKDKNVIFQWRTWDYLNTNLIPWNMVPGNTQQFINVFHMNAISLDNDGNYLLGTVGMGLKISRQTGQIIWIIGGIMNQFSFTNVPVQEAVGDFGGHTFQRLPNGNILVLDNSPFPWQQGYGLISSEVVEYSIDEEKKTATLVWKYKPDQIISGWHAGSVQRLSNGNTLICWGGPPNEGTTKIPIVTEVNASGEKLFELFYDGTDLESYRAFRFKLDDGKPNTEVSRDLLMAQNTYIFYDNNKPDPGIEIKVNNINSLGYNMVTVKNYLFSPSNILFNGTAPVVIPRRILLTGFGISEIDAVIRFDINNWKVKYPETTKIYYRKTANSGEFIQLETTYNYVTGKLTAPINVFGEYILAVPDYPVLALPPKLNSPLNGSTVNYKQPLQFLWSPTGTGGLYTIQMAKDSNFISLVLNESGIKTANFFIYDLTAETRYFWRVKTTNSAGESEWSKVSSFTAKASFINIKKPDGGEKFNIGKEYYLSWEKNFGDAADVYLLKADLITKKIARTTNSFILWEVDLNLPLSDDYKIKVVSSADTSLFDISTNNFSIVNTVDISEQIIPQSFYLSQNYPNPFNPVTNIDFNIPEAGFVSLILYNPIGEKVETIINQYQTAGKYSVKFKAGSNLKSGIYLYRLQVNNYSSVRKLILLK